MTILTDETLAAFVDGELSPEEAAQVVMRLADDPEAQARVDALFEANRLVATAFDAPMREPVPERLRRAVEGAPGGAVIAFPRRVRPLAAAAFAMAASVALVIVFGGFERDGAPFRVATGLAPAGGALHAALETRPSGVAAAAPDGVSIAALATFRDAAGRPCREFEALSADMVERGVACRDRSGWTVEVAVVEAAAPGSVAEGFSPASGPSAAALDDALDALGAGMALDADTEGALLARGWRD